MKNNAARSAKNTQADDSLLDSIKHLLADQKGIKDQLRSIRKSIAIPKSEMNLDVDPESDGEIIIFTYKRWL